MSRNSKLPLWVREMLAELVGTYFLIMIGDGGVANYMLNRHSNGVSHVDHFSVAFTFGIAAMIGIAAAFPISGAHLNPAVTLGFACVGRFPFRKVAHYFLGQYLGAFLAAVTVFLVYFDAINAYDDGIRIPYYSADFYNNTSYARIATGGVFSTYPAPWMTVVGTLVDQVVATFSLVFGAIVVTSPHAGLPAHLHPFMLGMLICGLVVAFGLNCGAALNPARDLSPRLFQLLAGYGWEAFKPTSSLYWLTAGIIGPHLGGILGAWAYDWVLFYNDDKSKDNEESNDNKIELEKTVSTNDDSSKPFLVVKS